MIFVLHYRIIDHQLLLVVDMRYLQICLMLTSWSVAAAEAIKLSEREN